MMKKRGRSLRDVVLATGLALGLLGLAGCSDSAPAPTDAANKAPGARRDAIEKANYERLKAADAGKPIAERGQKNR